MAEVLLKDWQSTVAGTTRFWTEITQFLEAKFARGVQELTPGQEDQLMQDLKDQIAIAQITWREAGRFDRVRHLTAMASEVDSGCPPLFQSAHTMWIA